MYTNIESHRTPETNVMLYVNYTSIKKEKKKERKEEEANATTLETEAFVMVWYREPSTDEITVQSKGQKERERICRKVRWREASVGSAWEFS